MGTIFRGAARRRVQEAAVRRLDWVELSEHEVDRVQQMKLVANQCRTKGFHLTRARRPFGRSALLIYSLARAGETWRWASKSIKA